VLPVCFLTHGVAAGSQSTAAHADGQRNFGRPVRANAYNITAHFPRDQRKSPNLCRSFSFLHTVSAVQFLTRSSVLVDRTDQM
jgi:hypothetical protein